MPLTVARRLSVLWTTDCVAVSIRSRVQLGDGQLQVLRQSVLWTTDCVAVAIRSRAVEAADGREALCGAVDDGVCSTGSSAAVCSSAMCSANFFDTNGIAADSFEEPCGAVENGVCSTCSFAVVCGSVTCNANFFDTNADAADSCGAPCGAADNRVCSVVVDSEDLRRNHRHLEADAGHQAVRA